MEVSLIDARQRFLDTLLQVHWRQWNTLGASSGVEKEERWIIDLESLIVSTFSLGLRDKDLLSAAIDWMAANGDWINLSRYKRVRNIFLDTESGVENEILNPDLFASLPPSMSRYARLKDSGGRMKEEEQAGDAEGYKGFFGTFEFQGAAREPNIRHTSLVQLLLRGVFGIDARSEVLIYLLCHESGNSNSIARELYYDQKAVYRIMERWKAAGVLETISGGGIGNCCLKKDREWMLTLGLSGRAHYFNWVRAFLLCSRVLEGLWDDRVLREAGFASSFFRGLYEDARSVARHLSVEVPDPELFSEVEFAPVFVAAMIRILESINEK